ncbi:MAG: hypothetical protein HRU34_10970 [Richelia sp.]|nr:hypothetical protein [Richelia sp.]
MEVGKLPQTLSGEKLKTLGIAESGNDFTKLSTIYQWFQTLIHPALMQGQTLITYQFYQ